jgi:hypothetical protein
MAGHTRRWGNTRDAWLLRRSPRHPPRVAIPAWCTTARHAGPPAYDPSPCGAPASSPCRDAGRFRVPGAGAKRRRMLRGMTHASIAPAWAWDPTRHRTGRRHHPVPHAGLRNGSLAGILRKSAFPKLTDSALSDLGKPESDLISVELVDAARSAAGALYLSTLHTGGRSCASCGATLHARCRTVADTDTITWAALYGPVAVSGETAPPVYQRDETGRRSRLVSASDIRRLRELVLVPWSKPYRE